MSITVPYIDLTRFESGFQSEWQSRVAQISAKAQYIGGAWVDALEKSLAAETGAQFVISCANGTDALQLALRALGIGTGDTVLVPNLTFWASFEAVKNVGASPYLVDCDVDDQAIDINLVRQLLETETPAAVMVVHLYGWGSASLQTLRQLCRNACVPLIEDAAQAFGVTYAGQSVIAGAQIATTSFYPAKVLGAAGDGGAVFCQDAAIAQKVRSLSNHGRRGHYDHEDVGWNSRLDGLQAAYLELSLQHLPARLASRRSVAERYRQMLRLWEPDLVVVSPPDGYTENGYCNVCLIPDLALKKAIETHLRQVGIGFGNVYPQAISDQPGAVGRFSGLSGGDTSRSICEQVLNLPLFPYMTDAEVQRVVTAVSDAIKAYRQSRRD